MPGEIENHVRVRIRHCRWMQNLTQEELSKRSGLDVSEIQQLETGGEPILVGSLWKVALALGVPIAFFFEGLEGQEVDVSELRGAFIPEEEAIQLVRIYSGLPPAQRRGILYLAETLRDAAG